MGDEDKVKPNIRQTLRRPKIIIRKCKKPSVTVVSKSIDEFKKVNGELSAENKGKESNEVVEVEVIKLKKPASKSFTKGIKRKLSKILVDETIVVEDDSSRSEDKKDNGSDGKDDACIEFKGFKKRILAQTEKLKDGKSDNTEQGKFGSTTRSKQRAEKLIPKPKIVKINKVKKKTAARGKKGNEDDSDENQAESQTEYAQYLGLQPTMQFKCYRCGEKGFPSMLALNLHQRGCGIAQKSNFIANLQQDTTIPPSDPNMLTNFRITRKVYLCSACGTYYENWNLFLHMRDVHKKHICLFCLTMFGIAEKLADHLKSMHNVKENTFKSSEEFQSTYKGSCYLICCTCENMFNEREDYFDHQCVRKDPSAKCNLCGVKCGHYYTCPNSNTPRTISSVKMGQPASVTKSQTVTVGKFPMSAPKSKTSEELWMGKKGRGLTSLDNDDDYDISHAASFCHVDIADESGEKDKSGTENNPVDITDDEPLKVDKPTSDQLESTELKEQKIDDNILGKGGVQSDEGNSEKTATSVELEKVSLEKSTDEGVNDKVVTHVEDITNEKPAEKRKDSIEDVNVEKDCVGNKFGDENSLEGNVHKDSADQNKEEMNVEKEHLKELPKESDHAGDNSSQQIVAATDKIETDKILKADDVKSQQLPQKDKDESSSSESDGERVTHLSASQDDSESSSDESTDGENKKADSKQSADSTKDDSACESDDSDKSGLVVDEKLKSLGSFNSEDSENKSHKNMSDEGDSLQEPKSIVSNEAFKDLHFRNVSVVDKQTEHGEKENGSADSAPEKTHESAQEEVNDGIPLASEDVPAMALTLEDKLEDASSQSVVKECVRTSCLNCVYCSHAIKIAVNGKQLALHLLAEHRYKPVKNNETSQDVVKKLKCSLTDLDSLYFNTDSYDSSDKSLNASYDYTYECFQCRFVTKIHKELYVHKRKMHQKTVLLCVMCKSNFYSYSELLCHMCPGIYVSEDINFRCCFCNLDKIPSAFRLMVHLRKSHHTCDICLEVAGDQQKLSTHMWKHKLNHLCYRCGIAYRNKPDITKHLFWKHGTESVLCKKCLQKKWPHVYHFCIPPTVFICEECNASFTKAVALKVHKRLHGGELPYGCSKCDQKFVSKKLLRKHEDTHNQPLPSEKFTVNKTGSDNKHAESADEHVNVESIDVPGAEGTVKDNISSEISKENDLNTDGIPVMKSKKKKKRDKDRKDKPVVDVYDLPPLNLSSESDSSDEESKPSNSYTVKEKETPAETEANELHPEINSEKMGTSICKNSEPPEESPAPVPIVDGVWDNFHSYKAELEKRESKDLSLPNILPSTSSAVPKIQTDIVSDELSFNWALKDHSYCLIPGKPKLTGDEKEPTISEPVPVDKPPTEVPEETPAPRGHSSSIDHAYATLNNSTKEAAITTATAPEQASLEKAPTTPPQPVTPPLDTHSSSKKKQKTPKKKKHNTNSSSSCDSSSGSDTSSCSCGPNCSCSSGSSCSSSQCSSDSESSTSEGRQRAAARRDKKKERLKHKHKEEVAPVPEVPVPQPPAEEPVVDVPIEPVELPIRESDLDTEESSTDEDFYDKYPQSHAKQQIEKRNKLMLLASVAPVNNGTVSPPPPPTPVLVEKPHPPPPAVKRKIKTKKRRKSQQTKKSQNKPISLHFQAQPSTSISLPIATSTPTHILANHHNLVTKVTSPLRTPVSTLLSDATAGSGSENESTRLSKRKRVRNKFYGYSSEEEEHERPGIKWKKVDPVSVPQQPTPGLSFQPTLNIQRPQGAAVQVKRPKPSESSGSDEEPNIKKEDSSNSSSSSSDSENEVDSKSIQKEQTDKSDNLYCYCQCPYDEVSEMIACDGQDCTIEWFHFECVGIMVPPKGKWYCPDCRKRRDLM